MEFDIEVLRELSPRRSADVLSVAVRATTNDGVKPLSEQTVLDLGRLCEPGDAPTQTSHLLVVDRPGEINARVLGYAHVEHDATAEFATYELVVHPEHRRVGIGTAMLTRVLATWPTAHGWAHGNLAQARGLTDAHGLRVVRDLWQMSLPLQGEDVLPEVVVPEGFAVRSFEVGTDEDEWLRVNAAAFAGHGEQGRMALRDLRDRMSQPWFDPHGFLLIEDVSDPDHPQLAAFHWTKVEPAEPGSSSSTAGEVYVVGVDPAYQGRGLGSVTTQVGLRHLRACGLAEATLYVDGDNAAAVATYGRLGFTQTHTDVMYAA